MRSWHFYRIRVHNGLNFLILFISLAQVCLNTLQLKTTTFTHFVFFRFFVIMYPLKSHLYLKKRYVFSIAAFNFLFSVFHMSDYLFVYSDLLVSSKFQRGFWCIWKMTIKLTFWNHFVSKFTILKLTY